MEFERLLAMTGLADFFADPFWFAQLGATGLSAFLFLCTLVMSVMAFRAAGAARRARGEALDVAAEVRRLTAQMENATARRATVHAQDAEALELSEDDRATTHADETEFAAAPDRTLEDAKTAATIPSALLGRFRHWRK